jgi:hypothetical protein
MTILDQMHFIFLVICASSILPWLHALSNFFAWYVYTHMHTHYLTHTLSLSLSHSPPPPLVISHE